MATYTPRQKNWKWYADDAAEPTSQLANENAKPTLANNTSIIRLRVCIAEIGGKADTSVTISIEYSTDDVNFTAFGAGNHWNYANGQGTNGSATTTFKLTDTSTHSEYCEAANAVSIGASSANELDIAIVPTATVTGNTTYYFRVKGDGNVIALDTSETHPQVLTAVAVQSYAITGSGGGVAGGSATIAYVKTYAVTGAGGGVAGGAATIASGAATASYSITGAGGGVAGGSAVIAGTLNYQVAGTGGAVIGGAATIATGQGAASYSITGDGGGILGGTAEITGGLNYQITGSGGFVVGGQAVIDFPQEATAVVTGAWSYLDLIEY